LFKNNEIESVLSVRYLGVFIEKKKKWDVGRLSDEEEIM